ncbi:hypothetical protein Ccar_12095 [Clostridium carboxidivorans P7]|uniref:DUF2680 domain-containing protein n=1 Tax=Clostridium carboxidivorans P7 TaxID=536227 RepID=C6PXB4_9CLOT|nr:hypothetical protein [Clostridium carboxidivorans]AKN31562.1 hypothetical protein Ccar_12095 [Clostridium carboxidivorans P7]EET86103.1 conserved hypothetical protein [Clostridium carboxidivorans P7]EFG87028.1 hypothetical protein CLCAR_3128 [Clostridium carboxidivorans P7]
MKKKNLIIALTMTLAVGIGATAYASASTGSTSGTNGNNTTHQRVGFARVTGTSGYDYVQSILKNNLGMTDKEITDGLNSGKTMYDLAKEKGMTEEQFKAALLEERNKAVDKAVADGKITKEEGTTMKETLKNNLANCTGVPGQGMGNGGRGHMGHGGRGTGSCHINNSVE